MTHEEISTNQINKQSSLTNWVQIKHRKAAQKPNLSRLSAVKVRTSRTVLMYNPISPLPFRSTPTVEHQSLLHPNSFCSPSRPDRPILARCFPVPVLRRPVQSLPVLILPIFWTEEEPLVIIRLYQRHIYNQTSKEVNWLVLISSSKNDPVPKRFDLYLQYTYVTQQNLRYTRVIQHYDCLIENPQIHEKETGKGIKSFVDIATKLAIYTSINNITTV